MRFILVATAFALAAMVPAGAQTAGKVWDSQLSGLEREFIPLVEAVPADAFGFAPSMGEFKKARTFSEQARHVATVTYMVAAAMLGEASPVEAGPAENGPEKKSKAEVVQYCKDAMAYAHKAVATLTDTNQMQMVKSPFGDRQVTRMSLASIILWHSFDHYGQMAVYARMNGVVPPASR